MSMTFGEAIRAIAERTSFRTEDERRDVLATIDDEIAAHEDQDQADDDGKAPTEPTPEPTPVTPVKATGRKATGRKATSRG